ncbi:hypothetical protein ACFWQ6_26930 [Streptomyces coelicoflavus]|uniref:hypothetical protein n=1 Tax=Streptomyces TaxID=1883 RepID=UPI001290BFD3|nr:MULTISPECIES: hypothetical protein [Streptomyces]MCX5041065.1 hypothetical protein [Streptomyces coelicoflavus]MDI6516548.1 hypothetical protein [Streptomyces coelicoflavus]QFX79888.1 hypothetical protein GEV49_02295 [Streptomyces sp. SYP-A7193]
MTTETSGKPAVRRLETGWSKARRLRSRSVMRTCVPAVEDGSATRAPQPGQESNIVRGED